MTKPRALGPKECKKLEEFFAISRSMRNALRTHEEFDYENAYNTYADGLGLPRIDKFLNKRSRREAFERVRDRVVDLYGTSNVRA